MLLAALIFLCRDESRVARANSKTGVSQDFVIEPSWGAACCAPTNSFTAIVIC